MVLINIGVELNRLNTFGFKPLFLAHASNMNEIQSLLIENGAKMFLDIQVDTPSSTVLDVNPEIISQQHIPTSTLNAFLTLPKNSTHY